MAELHDYAIYHTVRVGNTYVPTSTIVRAFTAADALTQFTVKHPDAEHHVREIVAMPDTVKGPLLMRERRRPKLKSS